jgi:hypothetical protein
LLFVKSRVLMELPTCSTSFGTSCERKMILNGTAGEENVKFW